MSYFISELSDSRDGLAEAARSFCLRMIKQYYGIPYRADWHADLDSMLGKGKDNWFSLASGGGFWLIQKGDDICATIGIYDLDKKSSTLARLSSHYSDGARICQLVRAYVSPEHQGEGMGTALLAQAEAGARALGYSVIYLHADSASDATLSFWKRRGYTAFGSDETGAYLDFEKVLCSGQS